MNSRIHHNAQIEASRRVVLSMLEHGHARRNLMHRDELNRSAIIVALPSDLVCDTIARIEPDSGSANFIIAYEKTFVNLWITPIAPSVTGEQGRPGLHVDESLTVAELQRRVKRRPRRSRRFDVASTAFNVVRILKPLRYVGAGARAAQVYPRAAQA